MKVTISRSELQGKLKIPSSKSQTIRGLVCAALSGGQSELVNPLVCEDTEAAAGVLGEIGVRIQREGEIWRIRGDNFREPDKDLDCGESATTMRFMTAVCALVPGRSHLVGGPSLSKRPMRSLAEALQKLGVKCAIEGKMTPPVTVEGATLKGGETSLPGNISSQFISALLLVAPLAQNKDTSIRLTTELTSRPYLLMTLRCMRKFGIRVEREFDKFVVARQKYKATRFEVEGDWSSASYFLALGAFSEGVTVDNLSTSSLQGDRVILDILRNMGATVRIVDKAVTVSKAEPNLKAANADLTDCIDLLPTVAVLAALAEGTSVFTGITRARIKESNRVAAMREGLQRLGVEVYEDKNRLTIVGLATRKQSRGDEDEDEEENRAKDDAALAAEPEVVAVRSWEDHRIAMAFGVLGAVRGGVAVEGAECVAKTYPEFWDVLESIGGKLARDG